MKKTLLIILLFSSRFIYASISDPLNFPDNTVTSGSPLFVWEDIYQTEEKNVTYRLSITYGDETVYSMKFIPAKSEDRILSYNPGLSLQDGTYTYEITSYPEKRYFGFRKYPVTGSFTVDNTLPAEYAGSDLESYSVFLYMNHYNRKTTLNDSIFFFSASTISLAAGITTYMFFNFNIYTAIASYTMMGAAAIGFPASGYYMYKYFSNKNLYKRTYLAGTVSMELYLFDDNFYSGVTTHF
ncbi:MAG: hypothetical protein JW982_08675 [Spirochaetes bacterium]|nr:hypothetical protein [Spirochaetota bacterium]